MTPDHFYSGPYSSVEDAWDAGVLSDDDWNDALYSAVSERDR